MVSSWHEAWLRLVVGCIVGTMSWLARRSRGEVDIRRIGEGDFSTL